jgi:SAM-dependent methyltransferase
MAPCPTSPTASSSRDLAGYLRVDRCDNCESRDAVVYGVAADPDTLHPIQLRCRRCGLVYTSPRLSAHALGELYAGYHEHWDAASLEPELLSGSAKTARRRLARIAPLAPGRRLLDVGSGSGAFLAEARAAGFEVTGLEPSTRGAAFAADRFGIHEILVGTLESVELPAAGFDVVNAWHVVEHVFDLDGFVRELARLLPAGGVAAIGTESYAHPANRLLRATRLARGRLPRPATSTLHTFVFSPEVLRDVFERRGFATAWLAAYDELSVGERLRAARRRPALAAAVVAGESLNRALRRGPFLDALFVRS